MILIINTWSSSIKFSLFNKSWAELFCKNIWINEDYIQAIFQELEKINLDKNEVKKIWFRIVHWWNIFFKPTEINEQFIEKFKKLLDLAPFHNPQALEVIEKIEKEFTWIKKFAVFDTEFHKNIPKENKNYSIPLEISEKYWIHKFWFHWISYEFILNKIKKQKDVSDKKIIICHLWSGSSICTIKDWKSFDTSMWFTPVSWLNMSTRSWDIWAWVIFYLLKKWYPTEELEKMLNFQSWLKWISWESDMKTLLDKWEKWDEKCKLAEKIYINSVKKYIWKYSAEMWWLDILIFTWGIWEQSFYLREKICENMEFMWIKINKEKNLKNKEWNISFSNIWAEVLILKTDEQRMIFEKIF